jgi:hypothetical protein
MAAMRTWTARTTTGARTDDVLAALTDPEACRRWAPVPFDVEDDVDRLRPGTRTRVFGSLAGRRVGFEVEVHEADHNGLRLSARGPVHMDVAYDLSPGEITASVSVHSGNGLLGRLLAEATNGLLKAGALSQSINRLAAIA